MSNGEITAAKHFDSKAEVEAYIRTLNIRSMFFMLSWYMQNNMTFMKPEFVSDNSLDIENYRILRSKLRLINGQVSAGKYTWWSELDPDSRLPMIDIRDTGKFIAPALMKPDVYDRKNFTCATQFYTPAEIVETWTTVTGKEVYQAKGRSSLGAAPAEVQNMLKKISGLITVYAYFGPTGQDDLKWTLEQLTDKPTSWKQFVEENQPWFED